MIEPPIYKEEDKRLAVLEATMLLSRPSDPRFDELASQAAEALDVPISTVAVIDRDEEIYIGNCGLSVERGQRSKSFCGHALVSEEILICNNVLADERFKDNPYVVGPPYIRFYAGMKLIDHKTGQPLAVFCVKDTKQRAFSAADLATFMEFADRAEGLINSSRHSEEQEKENISS